MRKTFLIVDKPHNLGLMLLWAVVLAHTAAAAVLQTWTGLNAT